VLGTMSLAELLDWTWNVLGQLQQGAGILSGLVLTLRWLRRYRKRRTSTNTKG
jgi:hypothetical protein